MQRKKLLTVFVSIIVLSVQTVFSEVYYVATNGNDDNIGTKSQPWKTLQYAANTLVAGDTVIVMEGTYNTSMYFKNSGNAVDGYITYLVNPGDNVIIDGTGVPEYQYGDMDGLINSQGKSYIKFIGFHIDSYETWFGIYFRGPANHIEIRDCIVSNGNPIDHWGGHAFVIWAQTGNSGPISNVIIDGNEVYNNYTGGNEQLTIYGEVNNFEITNNIIHDCSNINMDMIGRIDLDGVTFGRPYNGLVKGNICYGAGSLIDSNSWGSGIYGDGAGNPSMDNNIIIEENICYGNDFSGIEIGDEHDGEFSGGILVKNNISYANDYYGIQVGGGGIGNGGTVQNVKLYNNTTYNNLVELSFSICENVDVKNNIFYKKDDQPFMWLNDVSVGKVNFDYNCWYSDGSWNWGSIEYNSLSELQQATGQFQHGIVADPLFVDATNHDFHLEGNSSCIDAGINVGIVYEGSAPDMGAFEFGLTLGIASQTERELGLFNYPNPFSDTTKISYYLPQSGKISIDIFDINGKLIKNLVNKIRASGNYTVFWDGTNENHYKLPSNTYIIVLSNSKEIKSFKAMILH